MKKWVRNLLKGLSLSAVLFTFQACYGTVEDFGMDVFVKGIVVSKTSGLPIKGIKVSVPNLMQYVLSSEDGFFSFYTASDSKIQIVFEDIDSNENGLYAKKDTIITNLPDNKEIALTIQLEELNVPLN
jgi:hypothetical protein